MNTTKRTIQIYLQHAWRYKVYFIGMLVAVPVATISFRLLPPLIAAGILERLSNGDFIKGNVWESFGQDILLYATSVLIGGILMWRTVIYIIWKHEGYVLRDLYRTMFDKYMNLSASFHADNFGGSLVSRTNKFTTAYVRLADAFIFQFYGLVISVIFVSIALFPKSPLFVMGLLTCTALFITITIKLSKRIRELGAIEANAQNTVTGYLADGITNIMAIKSFASKNYETKRFEAATEKSRQKTIDLMWGSLKFQLFASTVTSSLLVIAVVIAVFAVTVYGADAATIFLMFTYAAFIGDQLWEFGSSTLRNYNRSMGDAHEAVVTLDTPLSVKDPQNPQSLLVKSGTITFDNVIFDHSDDTENPLFAGLNLDIKDGEKIGLVGRSGGGKTTITKLLLRFMDIDSGHILIDGQDIAKVTQADLRQTITYVPQEPLLFHRSLSENIRYGKQNATEKEMIKVSKMAHAHEFIKDLPKAYDTLVGERGVKLSGGQRQRVAIARAMLKNAPILILDEATSALDSESEVLIQDALWKLMEGKTAIVIAHRLSTIQKMDRIIVLDDGKIVEEGSHKELLKRNGTYAKLWSHQSGGFIEE